MTDMYFKLVVCIKNSNSYAKCVFLFLPFPICNRMKVSENIFKEWHCLYLG